MVKVSDTSVSKVRIVLKSFDHVLLDEACKTIIDVAERSGAVISGPVPLPVKIKKFTINKSTFVNKTSRDQYEIRTHKRLIDIHDASPKTIQLLSSLHLPSGVEVVIKMI
jgi:small subunit ribosomal protein S10